MMSNLLKKILCCGVKNYPSDLPEGRVRVYVGKDVPCKFEVEANYLNHPLFEILLEISGAEFGYSYKGALRTACEIDHFQHLMELLKTRNLISKFYGSNQSRKGTQRQN